MAAAPCVFGEDLQAEARVREKQQVLLVGQRGMGHGLPADICVVSSPNRLS